MAAQVGGPQVHYLSLVRLLLCMFQHWAAWTPPPPTASLQPCDTFALQEGGGRGGAAGGQMPTRKARREGRRSGKTRGCKDGLQVVG